MNYMSTLDHICIWSDDTTCFMYELQEMIGFMSDDYIVVSLDDALYDDVSIGNIGYDYIVNARRNLEIGV